MRAADSRPYDVSPRRFETARPGGRALQKGRNPLAWAGEDTRPYGKTGNGSFFLWGLDTGRPMFRATARVAPTAENGPGAFARQGQAQLWNRSSSNFCKPRAQWPGKNCGQPLRFCAPEMFCLAQGVTPVKRGPGGGQHGGRGGKAVPANCAHPLAALWFLSARAERNSPPGGETLPVKRTTQRPDEGIGPYEIEAHARHSQKTSQSDHRPLIRLA